MSQSGRPVRPLASLLVFLLWTATVVATQSTANKAVGASAAAAGRPVDDPDFARAVKEWTTKPEFSSPLVDHLPKVTGVPSPEDVLGHHIREPEELTYY